MLSFRRSRTADCDCDDDVLEEEVDGWSRVADEIGRESDVGEGSALSLADAFGPIAAGNWGLGAGLDRTL